MKIKLLVLVMASAMGCGQLVSAQTLEESRAGSHFVNEI